MTSAVIFPTFGDPSANREASIAGAAFRRALKLGYSRVTALQFARTAKRDALDSESPAAVALRVVPPKKSSAMRPYTPGPTRPAA